MNSCMMALGWTGVMLLIGVYLRAKISFFKNMLVPASVIAGILGMIFINLAENFAFSIGTDTNMFNTIVSQIFTVSFISLSLTSTEEKENNKSILKGAYALGVIWCLLYALTPLIGIAVIFMLGKMTDMDMIYGTLIQFGFCQGPGQAAAYGEIFEQYGWENAATVAITFSVLGFIVAFLVGIPAAKKGIKSGIAKHCGRIDETTLRGYLKKEEQIAVANKDTTCNSNIETLAFHFAIIGLCYILAIGISKIFALLPGFLGSSMSNLMFMNGMYAAYLVKFVMKKLKIDYLLDNILQSKITGWTADYLVVCAFMAISVNVISEWLIPIVIVAVVCTIVTFVICFYFGQRIGGTNDFERTLGLYGTCTGTVPTGLALVRIVDPDFKTPTGVELGACNLIMLFSTPVYILLLAYASGSLGLGLTMGGLALCVLIYLVMLKVGKCWGKKSFEWKK